MTIDGNSESCTEFNSSGLINQCLVYSKSELNLEVHNVIITLSDVTFTFDAIDIDEARELRPYYPTPLSAGNALLRVTMNDSSEREYKLPATEINKFIQWINQTINAGNNCYMFNDTIDGSTEYLSFEKIISFKVLPLVN